MTVSSEATGSEATASEATGSEANTERGLRARVERFLFAPTDITLLAFFRIALGLVLALQGARYVLAGHADQYLEPDLLFTYWPFDFVAPFPRPGLIAVFGLIWLTGVLFAVGLWYRASAVVLFISLTYVFLLDATKYLNHHYLVCLLVFLMIFLPANRAWSADARLRPSIATDVVPAWTIWLLRFQIAVPYFFGGIAKLDPDWTKGTWFPAHLERNSDFPVIGRFFDSSAVADFMIWGALLLDLTVVFFLLHRRTRVWAYGAALAFHLLNSRLFDIGIFPWTMIAATTLFFPTDWPRRLIADLTTGRDRLRGMAFIVGAVVVGTVAGFIYGSLALMPLAIGALGGGVFAYFVVDYFRPTSVDTTRTAVGDSEPAEPRAVVPPRAGLILGALGVWVALQTLIPLRHFAIPGNVHWTEEGQRFSWHMLLDDKTGDVTFRLTLPETGETLTLDPAAYLRDHQLDKLANEPDLIVQFAHFLEERARKRGFREAEVRADAFVRLNYRPPVRMIDPDVDLTKVKRPWFGHADWITPFPKAEPLKE